MQSVLSRFGNVAVVGRQALFGERVGQRWIFRSDSGFFGREKITDYSILWIAAAFFIMGMAILIHSGLSRSPSSSVARWATTFGTITSVRVVERPSGDEARWFPEVSYQYSVQGRTVASTRLSRAPEISWRHRSDANAFLERYIARSRVLVYYNPTNVSESLLEPQSAALEPSTWMGLVLIALAFSVLLIYDRVS